MEGKARHHMGAYKSRFPSYLLLLFLVLTVLGFQGFQKISDKNLSLEIISQKDVLIQKLQNELLSERKTLNEVQGKLDELHKRTDILRTEKVRMIKRLSEIEIVKNTVEEKQMRLQSSLQSKENQINQLKEQERKVIENKAELQALTDLLERKDEEIKKLKLQLVRFEGNASVQHNTTEFSEHTNTTETVTDTEAAKLETHESKNNASVETIQQELPKIRAMEEFEKAALEDRLNTDAKTDGKSDPATELQTEDDENEKEEYETDEGDNSEESDGKEAENMDTEEDKDLEDLQNEDTELPDDEKETER